MNKLLEIATEKYAKIGSGRSEVFGDIWRVDWERGTVVIRLWGSHAERECRPDDITPIDAPAASDFYRICGQQSKKVKRKKSPYNVSISQSPFPADKASTAREPEASPPEDNE
jgi:hypothetical protein